MTYTYTCTLVLGHCNDEFVKIIAIILNKCTNDVDYMQYFYKAWMSTLTHRFNKPSETLCALYSSFICTYKRYSDIR